MKIIIIIIIIILYYLYRGCLKFYTRNHFLGYIAFQLFCGCNMYGKGNILHEKLFVLYVNTFQKLYISTM